MIARQSTLKLINKDFFGIYQITSKDIAGCFSSGTKLDPEKLKSKYKPLLEPVDNPINKEVKIDVTFGRMRFDKDNAPKFHGQFDPDNKKPMYQASHLKQMYCTSEAQSMSEKPIQQRQISDTNQEENQASLQQQVFKETPSPYYKEPYRIADVEPDESFASILESLKNPASQDVSRYYNQPPLTFFFQYSSQNSSSSSSSNEEPRSERHHRSRPPKTTSEPPKLSGHRLSEPELERTIEEVVMMSENNKPVRTLDYDPEKDQLPIQDLDPESEEYHKRMNVREVEFDKTLDEKYDIKKETESPMGGLDYLKKIRAQKLEPTAKGLKHRYEQSENPYSFKPSIKLDSQGFRNYTNQVPDWNNCRHVDILNVIKRSIVYHNYDILAVNKPYGIASHDEDKGREPIDINSLLHEMAKELRVEKFYLAHRLDKTTTGVLLFATSLERARHLNKLFKSDQIKKTYWCITRGVPDPTEGIIDIPIGNYKVAGKIRSCLAPEKIEKEHQLSERYREARRAISEYHVLESKRHAALVEVKPRTGVKHQIRCHLGFGINRPILGDHKYSNVGKLAPQTLPVPMLNLLHLRQAKVRTLPIHLHAKSVSIPGAKANGETLFINAPLPLHFVENLKALQLMRREDIKTSAFK